MAVGDPWNSSDGGTMNVFIPSSAPIVSSISTDSLMSHFDSDVYDKTDSSHIRHVVEALCGEAGMGQLLARSVRNWLDGGVHTAWLGFVDDLMDSVYGLPRTHSESTTFNPSDGLLTADEVDEALVKEGWYKERFMFLMKAFDAGGTVDGMRFACRAVCDCDCDVYETWRTPDVGRTGADNEVVIRTYSSDVSERQRELLLRVVDRIRPAGTVVTVDTSGTEWFTGVSPRAVAASSTYFEIRRVLTNSVDNSKLPPAQDIFRDGMAYGYDSVRSMAVGESAEVRKAIANRTQEYTEYYVSTKSSTAQVQSVDYTVEDQNGDVSSEDDWIERESTIRWSSWTRFNVVDSPDNYPGGKYGRTPMRAPALNKDGSDYIFPYGSQDEYEAEESRRVVADGGEVNGHMYRIRLSVSTTTVRYTGDMSLMSVNDASASVQALPEIEPSKVNGYSRVTLRNMQ